MQRVLLSPQNQSRTINRERSIENDRFQRYCEHQRISCVRSKRNFFLSYYLLFSSQPSTATAIREWPLNFVFAERDSHENHFKVPNSLWNFSFSRLLFHFASGFDVGYEIAVFSASNTRTVFMLAQYTSYFILPVIKNDSR